MTWAYKRVTSEQNFNYQSFPMTTTTALKQQIAALLCQLEETKEAERLEAARKEAEAVAEKARKEEEQRRLQAEAERVRHDAEERRIEQEWCEKEEEEEAARRHRSCEESALTPLAAPETELPKSKGKGLELALESEGGQESRRCDSCKKRDAKCVRLKVRGIQLRIQQILTTLQTGRSRSCCLCQELRIRCSTGGGAPVQQKRVRCGFTVRKVPLVCVQRSSCRWYVTHLFEGRDFS